MLLLITAVETLFPSTKPYLDFAADHTDEVKLRAIIEEAVSEYKTGMSFIDILRNGLKTSLPDGVAFPDWW